jgi:hypothetical protein
MKIAFIYALAAICTRTCKSAGECRRTPHNHQETCPMDLAEHLPAEYQESSSDQPEE